jgi:hypothetical protein
VSNQTRQNGTIPAHTDADEETEREKKEKEIDEEKEKLTQQYQKSAPR